MDHRHLFDDLRRNSLSSLATSWLSYQLYSQHKQKVAELEELNKSSTNFQYECRRANELNENEIIFIYTACDAHIFVCSKALS